MAMMPAATVVLVKLNIAVSLNREMVVAVRGPTGGISLSFPAAVG
jgi:hypothetical protein